MTDPIHRALKRAIERQVRPKFNCFWHIQRREKSKILLFSISPRIA